MNERFILFSHTTIIREKFKYQLSLIKKALCYKNCILLGDFNLNFTKKNDINYTFVRYFDDFDDMRGDNNLVQLIEFPTWSRIINNVLSESITDHIYVKDPTLVGGGGVSIKLSQSLETICLFL